MFDFCLDRTNLYLVDHFLKRNNKMNRSDFDLKEVA
jgi:hypothetical protein